MSKFDGIINLIKPPGMSSFEAVSFIKRKLGVKKAGHTGTLDPLACGVLPICLGKATKVIPFLPENRKEYIGELTLGQKTTTLDSEGEIVETNQQWHRLSEETILTVFKEFTGEIKQLPPMFSAVHYQGKRLYELAREGKEVERKARKVSIFSLEVLSIDLPRIRFRVNCSKGTYIRSLVNDLGDKLGVGAFLSFLVRTRSGPFSLAEALTLEEVMLKKEQALMRMDLPLKYPSVFIKEASRLKAVNGRRLYLSDLRTIPKQALQEGERCLVYAGQEFVSIDEVLKFQEDEIILKPLRIFISR